MNGIFSTYFILGFEHISDLAGYDHILFLVALCAVYTWSSWKKVAIIVTAFTIGHSLTLALAALNVLNIPADTIEFLIPVTIFITAISNTHPAAMAGNEKKGFSRPMLFKYIIALIACHERWFAVGIQKAHGVDAFPVTAFVIASFA